MLKDTTQDELLGGRWSGHEAASTVQYIDCLPSTQLTGLTRWHPKSCESGLHIVVSRYLRGSGFLQIIAVTLSCLYGSLSITAASFSQPSAIYIEATQKNLSAATANQSRTCRRSSRKRNAPVRGVFRNGSTRTKMTTNKNRWNCSRRGWCLEHRNLV